MLRQWWSTAVTPSETPFNPDIEALDINKQPKAEEQQDKHFGNEINNQVGDIPHVGNAPTISCDFYPAFRGSNTACAYRKNQQTNASLTTINLFFSVCGLPFIATRYSLFTGDLGGREYMLLTGGQSLLLPLLLTFIIYCISLAFKHIDSSLTRPSADQHQTLRMVCKMIRDVGHLEDIMCILSSLSFTLIFLGRVSIGQCPAGASVWASQQCNPVAASHSVPHDFVLIMCALPLVCLIFLRGTTIYAALGGYVIAITAIIYSLVQVGGWQQSYTVACCFMFVIASIELDRLMRTVFATERCVHEVGMNAAVVLATANEARHATAMADAVLLAKQNAVRQLTTEAAADRLATTNEVRHAASESKADMLAFANEVQRLKIVAYEADAAQLAAQNEVRHMDAEAAAEQLAAKNESRHAAAVTEADHLAAVNEARHMAAATAAERLALKNEARHAAAASEADLLAFVNEARHAATTADAVLLATLNKVRHRTAEAAAERLAAKNEARHAAAATEADHLATENDARYAAAIAGAKLLAAQNEIAMVSREQQQLRSIMGNVVS